MPIDVLNASLKASVSWNAQKTMTGIDYQPSVNASSFGSTRSVSTSLASTAAGGGNQVISFIQSIAGGANVTVDLQAVANIFGVVASLARLKGILFRLLSAADDATNGTAASQVTIGNAATNPHALYMGAGTHTTVLKNGEFICWGTSQAAGLLVSGTAKAVLITNNDGAVAAKV